MDNDTSQQEQNDPRAFRKIRQEPGRLKQTHISINGYEMHQMELLDRSLIAIQKTEDAYIDVNNRIINNINNRKERLNNLNGRIAAIAEKTLKLYNCQDAMRVESPANYPNITTTKSPAMHPHQSIFFDKQNVIDAEAMKDPKKKELEEYNLPELYSMQMNKKIYNNRLSNNYDNLGQLVVGVSKDVNEVTQLLLKIEKYGVQMHNLKKEIIQDSNTVRSKMQSQQKKNMESFDNEGILGKIPEGVESLAELMLQDSDVNVYQESKVVLKEEAFTIRGKKQKTRAQKEQIIYERRKQARANFKKLRDVEKVKMLAEQPEFNPFKEEQPHFNPNDIDKFRPEYRPIQDLAVGNKVLGLKNVADFDIHNINIGKKRQAKLDQTIAIQQQNSMNGSVMPGDLKNTLAQSNFDQQETQARQSEHEAFDTIAPAKGVAEKQAEYYRIKEEQDRQREAFIEQKRLQEENEDSTTNLPLEMLYKQKMDDALKKKMTMNMTPREGQSSQPNLNLATTGASAQTAQMQGNAPQTPGQPGAPPTPPPNSATPQAPAQVAPVEEASNVPKAPSIDEFYEFLGGGKPKATPTPASGDDLGGLLDEANMDLEFNPDKDLEFNSSNLDIDQSQSGGPPAPPKPKFQPVLSLAEQLAAQRAKMDEAAANRDKLGESQVENKPPPKAKDPKFMTLAEQLQAQKEKMVAAQKAKEDNPKPPSPKKPSANMSLSEQLAAQKEIMNKKNAEKEAKKLEESQKELNTSNISSKSKNTPKEEKKLDQSQISAAPKDANLGVIAEEDEEYRNNSIMQAPSEIEPPKPKAAPVAPPKPPAPTPPRINPAAKKVIGPKKVVLPAGADRRQSHMDILKDQILQRFKDINENQDAGSSDENESSSDEDSSS